MIPDKYKDKTFVAKPDTWFDEGTEVFMITIIGDADELNEFGCGLMKGWKSDHVIWTKHGKITKSGWDEEACSLGEFDIIDKPSSYKLVDESTTRKVGLSDKLTFLSHRIVRKSDEKEINNKIIYK